MIFSATEIIGKTLFVTRSASVHILPDSSSEIIAEINKNQAAGIVYSFVNRNGALWWMLEKNANGKHGYIKHVEGLFSLKALLDQGAIDTATQNKPKPTTGELFKDFVQKTIGTLNIAVPAILALIVLAAGFFAYKQIKK